MPVRNVTRKGWEVLIANENLWLSCDGEREAQLLAKAPVLEYESLESLRNGAGFAQELGELADTLDKYGMRWGARFFRRRAEEARQRRTT
jgi:hypothetical protein